MRRLRYVLARVFLLFLWSPTNAQTDNGNECSCFLTNGSSSSYFTYHRFYDYRYFGNISSTVPPAISNITDISGAVATSDYFTSDAFTSDWTIQAWNNSDSMQASGASVLMINSPSNLYIEQSADNSSSYDSYLTLRTARLPDFQSAAEIDSTEKNFHFLSARFLARVVGAPGACAGLFTYLSNENPQRVQEGDIEILTRDPRDAVQYTNQPSTNAAGNDVAEATVNATNPGGVEWTQWNVYRYDWTPKKSSWYVNGVSVANISFQAPKDPAELILNMWSDGGVWTGNMTVHDEAFLQLQWIQVVYNTSGPYAGSASKARRDDVGGWGNLVKRKGTPGCAVVCSIDEQVNVTGTPAILYNNTGFAAPGWKGEGMGALVWLPMLLVGSAIFGYL